MTESEMIARHLTLPDIVAANRAAAGVEIVQYYWKLCHRGQSLEACDVLDAMVAGEQWQPPGQAAAVD